MWLPIMNMCSNVSYITTVKYTVLILKIQVFWDVMPCRLVNRYQHSVQFKQLHLKDKDCIIYWHDTRVTPKVMPSIYFHGNYNRYKEHNNTI